LCVQVTSKIFTDKHESFLLIQNQEGKIVIAGLVLKYKVIFKSIFLFKNILK
jgi:hypothetical protein